MNAERPVALVTGSSKGLGLYIAQQLARTHYIVGCSRSDAVVGDEHLHVVADVTNEGDVLKVFRAVREKYGRLDVVINNAGTAVMNHILLTPTSTLDYVYSVNVRGTFIVSREAAKLMMRRSFGRIVNLTSIAAAMHIDGEATYAAAKSAVESLTRSLSRELAPMGITVNAVGPNPIQTDLLRGVPPAKLEQLVNSLAIKKLGEPIDVWNAVRFFIDAESRLITGQTLYLGGVC